jgi:Rieske Fe-S protein
LKQTADGALRDLDIQDRRTFCKRVVSVAAIGGGLPAVFAGCSSNAANSIPGQALPTVTGTVANGVVTVPIGSGSPLAATGGMALINSPAGNFLATRTGASSFIVLTAICTHQTCVISNVSGQTYVCPCHGSEFDTSGRVTQGPAGAPLRQFTAQFANDVLTFS